MTRFSILLALSLLFPVSSALAQESPPSVGVTLPPLPVASARLERRIPGFERTVGLAENCIIDGERGAYYEDMRCDGWYTGLARGGAASAHAIGRVALAAATTPGTGYPSDVFALVVTGRNPAENEQERESNWDDTTTRTDTAPRVATSLDDKGDILVPYLLHASARELASSTPRIEDVKLMLSVIETLTQHDPAPIAPWRPSDEAAQRDEVARRVGGYATWLNTHATERPATWQRDGLALARTELTSTSIEVRYSAMRRLIERGVNRDAVRRAMHDTLSSRDLSAEARSFFAQVAENEQLISRRELRRLTSAS